MRRYRSRAQPAARSRSQASPTDALSVGEFTRQIRGVLEGAFHRVRVHGEVIGLTQPRSGHVYFSLKDAEGEDAKVSVVLWRDRAGFVRFPLEDGLNVVVEGRLTVYEPRGAYQIVATTVSPAGQGTLLVAFERLKEKLWQEGLLDPSRKRPLPFLPRRVGVISSPSGAAVRDVLRSIHRRYPAWVRVLPARVQGEGAAREIISRLERIASDPSTVDVVILARGGGSLEDLWTFNEERVARAVAACPVPTVSGVGHEVDVTLVDLVADVRAQTPTQAGDLVVPDLTQVSDSLGDGRRRLEHAYARHWCQSRETLSHLAARLRSASPQDRLRRREEQLQALLSTFGKTLYSCFREWEDHISIHAQKLDALNPYKVLERGYSITRTVDGKVVTRASELRIGAELAVLLAEGEARVEVTGLSPEASRSPPPRGGTKPDSSEQRAHRRKRVE